MKQMQRADYLQARKINLEIQQLDDEEAPLSPGKKEACMIWVIIFVKSVSYIFCDNTLKKDFLFQH